MKTILEKLGIHNVKIFQIQEIGEPKKVLVYELELMGLHQDFGNVVCVLINMVKEGIGNYHLMPNSHRRTAEEYYIDEIKTIEEATGKTWEEIKAL